MQPAVLTPIWLPASESLTGGLMSDRLHGCSIAVLVWPDHDMDSARFYEPESTALGITGLSSSDSEKLKIN